MKTQLRNRWTDDMVRFANQGLAKGKVDCTPFGRIDETDRYDFRGLSLTAFVKSRTFVSVDFSCTTLSSAGQFMFCIFEDCVFDEMVADSNLGSSFSSCSFAKASLREADLCGSFTSCDFGGANLSKCAAIEVKFQGCSFASANFRRSELVRCGFEDCTFAGALFHKSTLTKSSFVRTDIESLELKDCLTEGVEILKDP